MPQNPFYRLLVSLRRAASPEATGHKAPFLPLRRNLRSQLKRLLFAILATTGVLMLVTAAAVALFPHATLGWLIQQWEIEHSLEPADAIIVLGGGNHFRPQHAAKLWNDDLAPVIVTFQPERTPSHKGKANSNRPPTDRETLLQLGIPSAAIHSIDRNVASTWDEAKAIQSWAEEHQADTVIIATDRFHSRRVNWLMTRTVENQSGCRCLITHSAWRYYQTDNWWQNLQGQRAFKREIFRMTGYLLYYSWR